MSSIRVIHAACTLACLLPFQLAAAAHDATVDLIDGKRLESLTIKRPALSRIIRCSSVKANSMGTSLGK